MKLFVSLVITLLFTSPTWAQSRDESPPQAGAAPTCPPHMAKNKEGTCEYDWQGLRKGTVTTLDRGEISRKEAHEIIDRHVEEIRKIPGHSSAYLDGEGHGMVLELKDPFIEGLPKDIEGIPVIPVTKDVPYLLGDPTTR